MTGKKETPPGAPALPPLSAHPEPHTHRWTSLESEAISQYGQQCAQAALDFAASVHASSAGAEPVELPDVEDLAHEITQDCLSFGLSTDTVARYLRSYEKKVRAALSCLVAPVAAAPAVPAAHQATEPAPGAASPDVALRVIAEWPCPEQDNMQAANMRKVAIDALGAAATQARERS